ncbi:MAG: fasciclin domain-containing protein [Bacteroidia bacterium]|nr:fasciclin domain-containing protein [Bacteroidia bacterium]
MSNIKFLIFALLSTSVIFFTSCDNDDDEPQIIEEAQSIVDLALDTDDLSFLVDALTQTGLVGALQGPGPYTVFAPTNQAFQNLLDSNADWNSLSDIDNATLSNILLFHVLGEAVMASDLSDKYQTTLSVGPNDESVVLQIDVTGGVKFNGSSEPTTTDIEASNGVIHFINEVMIPPSIVDLAVNGDVFSSLETALTRSDLTIDYVSILSDTGPFTVFAPTNQAFQNLLDSNSDWNTLNDIPVATLEAVLNYHVVQNANVQSRQLTDDMEITTLGGKMMTDLESGAKLETSSGQVVNIIVTNAQAINGVVHAVDAVLLP